MMPATVRRLPQSLRACAAKADSNWQRRVSARAGAGYRSVADGHPGEELRCSEGLGCSRHGAQRKGHSLSCAGGLVDPEDEFHRLACLLPRYGRHATLT